MNRFVLVLIAAGCVLARPASANVVQTINATTKPFTLAVFNPGRKKFGRLLWRGGVVVESGHPWFGGFSGLALSDDGSRFIAVSDRGRWLSGTFSTHKGRLQGVSHLKMSDMVFAKPRPLAKQWVDAEALAPLTRKGIDGPLLAGFERRERFLRYKAGSIHRFRRPRQVPYPKQISTGPANREVEGVGRFFAGPAKGWLLATSEQSTDDAGNIKSWLWRGARTVSFSVQRFEDYAITDLAVTPDGEQFITLERSFNLPNPPGFAVRVFKVSDIEQAATVSGEVLFSGRRPFYAGDNMEGLAVHMTATGRLMLTLISDDNFNRTLQRTLIMRFELAR